MHKESTKSLVELLYLFWIKSFFSEKFQKKVLIISCAVFI